MYESMYSETFIYKRNDRTTVFFSPFSMQKLFLLLACCSVSWREIFNSWSGGVIMIKVSIDTSKTCNKLIIQAHAYEYLM